MHRVTRLRVYPRSVGEGVFRTKSVNPRRLRLVHVEGPAFAALGLPAHHRARLVILPQQCRKHRYGTAAVCGVRMMSWAAPDVNNDRLCRGEFFRYPAYRFRRNGGYFFRPLRRLVRDKRRIFIESHRVIRYEFLIVPFVHHDLMPEREGKGAVRSRSDRYPFIRFCGGLAEDRININHLCAARPAEVPNARQMGPLRGAQQVPAEHEGVLRICKVGKRTVVSHHQFERCLPRYVAEVRMHRKIRRAVQKIDIRLHVRKRRVFREPDKRLGAILITNLQQVFRYIVEGLFPRYGLPFSRAPRSDPLHRLFQSVRIIERPRGCVSLGTHAAAERLEFFIIRRGIHDPNRVILVRLDFHDPSVNHMHLDSRGPAAMMTGRIYPFAFAGHLLLGAGLPEKAEFVVPQEAARDGRSRKGRSPLEERPTRKFLFRNLFEQAFLFLGYDSFVAHSRSSLLCEQYFGALDLATVAACANLRIDLFPQAGRRTVHHVNGLVTLVALLRRS